MAVTITIPNVLGTQSGPTLAANLLDANWNAIRDAVSGLVPLVSELDDARTYVGTQIWAKGANIADAAAITISSDGNYFAVDGTTTVTSISTLTSGALILLRFTGARTLTHNATSLILMGATNATTANGDLYWFVSEGSGNWREIWRRPVTGAIVTNVFSGVGTWITPPSGAVADFVTITSGDVTTASATLVALTGATLTKTTGARRVQLNFISTFSSSGTGITLNLTVDGTRQLGTTTTSGVRHAAISGQTTVCVVTCQTAVLSAASHTFTVEWTVAGGGGTATMSANTTNPFHFSMEELMATA